jgi:hypothetical protein
MEDKRLFDRMINEVRIVHHKGIPCGFLTVEAPSEKPFFLLGHRPKPLSLGHNLVTAFLSIMRNRRSVE